MEHFGVSPPKPKPSCLEPVFEECLDATGGIDGDMGFTECEVFKYVDTCENEEVYCWTYFVYEGQEWEGFCHELFFNETHGDEWCKAAEYGPFECPAGFGLELCEYYMFRNCEGEETCFVDYIDENSEWAADYCQNMKFDDEECQVVCTEAYECEDSSFESC